MQSTGRVRGAVVVLGAGVAEVDLLRVDGGATAFFRFVVDYGSVWASGGDGIEREAGEVFIFAGSL